MCNNNYNNYYLLNILICLQYFCQPHWYVILLTRSFVILFTTFLQALTVIHQIFTSVIFKHATCLNTRLTELTLTVVYSVLPFYSPTRSVKRTFLKKRFLCEHSRLLYCDRFYMFILIHIFSSCLLLMVYFKAVRCMCVCMLCTHCHLLFSISFILMVFVFAAFAYCFM